MNTGQKVKCVLMVSMCISTIYGNETQTLLERTTETLREQATRAIEQLTATGQIIMKKLPQLDRKQAINATAAAGVLSAGTVYRMLSRQTKAPEKDMGEAISTTLSGIGKIGREPIRISYILLGLSGYYMFKRFYQMPRRHQTLKELHEQVFNTFIDPRGAKEDNPRKLTLDQKSFLKLMDENINSKNLQGTEKEDILTRRTLVLGRIIDLAKELGTEDFLKYVGHRVNNSWESATFVNSLWILVDNLACTLLGNTFLIEESEGDDE